MDIAAGFAVHTGWAIAVLVAGDLGRPVVLDRRRVALVPDALPRQAYHAAQDLPLEEAEALVAEVLDATERTTTAVLDELTQRAAADGTLVAIGLTGAPRDVPDLPTVLASHPLLHLAEGELYRGALCDAAHDRGLVVHPLHPKHWAADTAHALGSTEELVIRTLAGLRASLGTPWQLDHRIASAAALTALASAR